jgi:hypothetical protein
MYWQSLPLAKQESSLNEFADNPQTFHLYSFGGSIHPMGKIGDKFAYRPSASAATEESGYRGL